ncbi:MAG: outer membrane lipid asymmetry maintenance protein MlaD [Rickettsiales bacterium]|nr:outer membrane lipid asymmetry maintenance protein MlaD [Rickettsiales bacterium]
MITSKKYYIVSMKKNYFDLTIGVITVAFSIFFVLFSMKITDRRLGQKFYTLNASFSNIEGVGLGTKVKICGVEVGKVSDVTLNDRYDATLTMDIKKDVNIPADSILKISTSGIIGGRYLKIELGGETKNLSDGEEFEFTEPSMDLEDMIVRFMLNRTPSGKK